MYESHAVQCFHTDKQHTFERHNHLAVWGLVLITSLLCLCLSVWLEAWLANLRMQYEQQTALLGGTGRPQSCCLRSRSIGNDGSPLPLCKRLPTDRASARNTCAAL